MIEYNFETFYRLGMALLTLIAGIYAIWGRNSIVKRYEDYNSSNKNSFLAKLIRQDPQKRARTLFIIGCFFIVFSVMYFLDIFGWFI